MSVYSATVMEIDPSPVADARVAAQPAARSHITALDGIRGLAIILVLLRHLFCFDVRGVGWVDQIYRFLSMGWIGVDLFFVLSGFLITGILIEAREKRSYFSNFYGRRAVRIFPLYYGILILGLAMGQLGHGQIWLWTYLGNVQIALANDWIPQTTGWLKLWQFWSLAIEEHFYLVWPVIVFLCPPRWLLRVAIALAILCCGARSIYVLTTGFTLPAYLLTPFRVDGLLIGAASAVAMRSDHLRQIFHRTAMPALAICTALLLIAYPFTAWDPASRFVATVGYALLAVLFASFIIAALTREHDHWLRRFTEHPFLRFFGKYSYGIYAFHTTIFVMLLPIFASALMPLVHSHTLSALLAKPMGIAVAVLAALLSWNLYEKHWLKLKRYFGGDATRSRPVPPLAANA